MNKLYESSANKLDMDYIIIIGAIVFSVLLVVAIVSIILHIKNKKSKLQIDSTYVLNLVKYLGGKENIDKMDVDGRKLHVTVRDLSIVSLEQIKALAQTGIFVSGNNIKALFKYDAEDLKKGIKTIVKE